MPINIELTWQEAEALYAAAGEVIDRGYCITELVTARVKLQDAVDSWRDNAD